MKWFGRKGAGAAGRPPLSRAWSSWASGGAGAGLGDWPQDYTTQMRAAVLANPVGHRCLRLICEWAGASTILATADQAEDITAAVALVR